MRELLFVYIPSEASARASSSSSSSRDVYIYIAEVEKNIQEITRARSILPWFSLFFSFAFSARGEFSELVYLRGRNSSPEFSCDIVLGIRLSYIRVALGVRVPRRRFLLQIYTRRSKIR